MQQVALRKLSPEEMATHYGGFGMMALLIAVLPMLIQSAASIVSSVKMLDAETGSVKVKGYESHWSSKSGVEPKAAAPRAFVYAY